jgi:hypothetical protein
MKIDMSSEAITRRLKMVRELRRVCLSLADTGAGQKIRHKFLANEKVQRTKQALGR